MDAFGEFFIAGAKVALLGLAAFAVGQLTNETVNAARDEKPPRTLTTLYALVAFFGVALLIAARWVLG